MQADPEEAAMPARSRANRIDSPSTKPTTQETWPGNRLLRSLGPVIPRYGIFLGSSLISICWSVRSFAKSRSRSCELISSALAKPTIAAVFSVPALRLFSCPPPIICPAIGVPLFIYKAPAPLGPYIL